MSRDRFANWFLTSSLFLLASVVAVSVAQQQPPPPPPVGCLWTWQGLGGGWKLEVDGCRGNCSAPPPGKVIGETKSTPCNAVGGRCP